MSDTEITSLRERWTAYLKKVSDRLQEIIEELEPQLPLLPSIQALLTALSAFDARVDKLSRRIEEKWSKDIESALEALTEDEQVLDSFRGLRDRERLKLKHVWESFRIRTCADMARALYPAVQRELRNPQRCQGCGAALVPDKPYRPQSIRCSQCGGVTQVLVRDAVGAYYGYAPDFLAAEASLPLRQEIERLQEDDRLSPPQTQDEEVAFLDHLEALESRHWMTFCEARAKVFEEPVDLGLHDARMEAFRRMFLLSNQVWCKAKKTEFT